MKQLKFLKNIAKLMIIKHQNLIGFLGELCEVDGCRKEWLPISAESKRILADNLFIQHEITYRIYRSWEDFEEYNLKNIVNYHSFYLLEQELFQLQYELNLQYQFRF